MHDLDRTLQTLEPEAEYGAGEYELSPEIFGGPGSLYGSRPLSEEAEMELAGELLAGTKEAGLQQFMEIFEQRLRKRHRHQGRRRLRRHFRRYMRDRDDDSMQPVPIAAAIVPAAPGDDPDDAPGEQELESAGRCVRLAAAVAKKAAENPAGCPPVANPAAAAH